MNLPIQFKFTPLEEFEWKRERKDDDGNVVESWVVGQYYPGMTYNCTREPRHDALRDQCKIWFEEGMIDILPLAPGQTLRTVEIQGGE